MAQMTYDAPTTALVVIDPYNDFISEGGKVWDRLKGVAEANQCVPHMLDVLTAARRAQVRVFYALHRRYRPGDYETWNHVAPVQRAAWVRKTFEDGTWGGEIRPEFLPQPGEIIALEHWCSSRFANTDLDLQLKRHGIQRLVVIGLSLTRVSRRLFALLRNSATTSQWSETRPQTTRMTRCMRRSM
jgi:ureidoacrylate peracid hydrolase